MVTASRYTKEEKRFETIYRNAEMNREERWRRNGVNESPKDILLS